MKRFLFIFAVLITASSCQEVVIHDHTEGIIAVDLTNSPVVELVTKANETVPTDNFNIYVQSASSGTAVQSFKLGAFPSPYVVPVGEYTLWADSVTESESITGWGAVRYATAAPVTKMVSINSATVYRLECAMVNTAVSVIFDGDFETYFSDYEVSVSMQDDEDRVLEYDAQNTSGETPAVGYFIPSAKLLYTFTAKDKNNVDLAPKSGMLNIAPATHLQLKFKVKAGLTGSLVPEIIVDTTCTVLTEEVEVDPTDIPNAE